MNAPFDVTGVRLETERLILRPWQETDLADFYEYARVDGVGQMAGWMPHKSMGESKTILDLFITEKKTFALELKETGKVIGSIGLELRDGTAGLPGELQGREVGYALSKDYWGRGLMPEAVKAVIHYCFETLRFDYLTCGHFAWNTRSRRVVEKCGFVYREDEEYKTAMGTVETAKMYVRYSDRLMTGLFEAENVHLETERLILRPIREADAEDLHGLLSDPEIADQSGFTCKKTLEETERYVKNNVDSHSSLVLVLKSNGRVVGDFCMEARVWEQYPLDPKMVGRECGFSLNRNYWGQGLMPEALGAVAEYCFRTLGYDFISAGHFLRNGRSGHMIRKCGFDFLFEDEFVLPGDQKERIRTYIRWNPYKERIHV